MKNDKVKISDIAKVLEISSISVSRALSGQSGVSDELRNRIVNKANEMGYIKVKNNNDISVLVLHQKPYIHDTSNYSYMVQGIEQELQKTDCKYDLEYMDKERQEKLELPNKIDRGINYDGIIFIGDFNNAFVKFMSNRIKNQVSYSGYSPEIDCDSVWFNFNNGGYKQCEYLIKRGHKNIGFLSDTRSYKNREKSLGITTALESYGLEVNNAYFIYEQDFSESIDGVVNSKHPPTAIICEWDYIAIKLLKYFYKKGIRVPEDISIVSSGNSDMSEFSIPALTTLEMNIPYSCEVAVSLILNRIANPHKPYENIMINSSLVERDSVREINN